MTVLDRLNKFIQENDIDLDEIEDFEDDDLLIEKMFDLIESLEPDQLSEKQADILMEVFELLAPEDDVPVDEVFKRRVRRDIATRRKRRREYRKRRAKVKLRARKYRRSALGRKTARRAKRFKKIGRTSTMKRQRKFIGPVAGKM